MVGIVCRYDDEEEEEEEEGGGRRRGRREEKGTKEGEGGTKGRRTGSREKMGKAEKKRCGKNRTSSKEVTCSGLTFTNLPRYCSFFFSPLLFFLLSPSLLPIVATINRFRVEKSRGRELSLSLALTYAPPYSTWGLWLWQWW